MPREIGEYTERSGINFNTYDFVRLRKFAETTENLLHECIRECESHYYYAEPEILVNGFQVRTILFSNPTRMITIEEKVAWDFCARFRDEFALLS